MYRIDSISFFQYPLDILVLEGLYPFWTKTVTLLYIRMYKDGEKAARCPVVEYDDADDKFTYICIDTSGSTYGQAHYWANVSNIVELHRHQHNIKIIQWASRSDIITYEEFLKYVKYRKGYGETFPSAFIPKLRNCGKLVIITDGAINSDEIDSCAELLIRLGVEFDSVELHFFKTLGEVNLSVAAPFSRNADFKIFIDGVCVQEGDTSSFDFTDYYNNPEKFIEEFNHLYGLIVMRNLGLFNKQMRNDILELQANLMRHLSANKTVDDSIATCLKDGKYEEALAIAQKNYSGMDMSEAKIIEIYIQKLINVCDLSGQYSFDLLKPARLERAHDVEKTLVSSIEVDIEEIDHEFECPILCDDDVPCLLVKKGDPAYEVLDARDKQAALTCPLYALNSPKFKEAILNRLDHVVGLKMTKEMLQSNKIGVSPYTRDKVNCAFVFGDENCDKAVDYSLSRLIFGTKIVGHPSLWLYVLYTLIKEKEYLAENAEFLKSVEKYLLRRLTTAKSRMSMSGLPIAPDNMTTLDVAVWYCVVSPFVVGPNVANDTNRLRSLSGIGHHLIDIVELLGYPYMKEKTYELLSFWRAFGWMMRQEHQLTQWRLQLRSHYQGTIQLSDGRIIPIDGPVTNPIDLPNFTILEGQTPLTLHQLVYLSEHVDVLKKVGSIELDIEASKEHPIPQSKYNYAYQLGQKIPESVELCPKTLRPYSVDRKSGLFWRKEINKRYPDQKRISIFKRFTDKVISTVAFPSKDEFIEYLYTCEIKSETMPRDTLPICIVGFVDEMYKMYETICGEGFSAMSPEEFAKIAFESRPLVERMRLDESPISEMPGVKKE